MMKPGIGAYDRFKQLFDATRRKPARSSTSSRTSSRRIPGTTDEDMLALALWLKQNGFRADQVQAFLPSPMASATAMYHTGKNPLRRVQPRRRATCTSPKGLKVRRLHKAFLRYHDPDELAAAARGAAPHGARRSDRQRRAPARAAAVSRAR